MREDGSPADDPVVFEMDVYLNQTMANDINVIQYPLRPFYRPLDLPHSVSIKEENKMLQQQYELDLGDCYNDGAAEHLQIRHQTMNSSCVAPSTHHAIGIVKKGKLHLTPVHRIYQMRPSFNHIDKAAADEEEMDVERTGVKSEMKQLSVQFKKKESAKALEYRQKSFAHKLSLEEAEPWVPLIVHGPEDEASKKAMSDLVQHDADPDSQFTTSQTGYLKNLRFAVSSTTTGVPKMPITAGAPEALGAGTDEDISKMSCEEQVRALLTAAQLLSFGQVRGLASAASDSQEVLRHLRTYGNLVNGFWVLKSEICYPEDEDAAKCRDFILIQFRERSIITRHAFRTQVNVSSWCLKEMLTRLCNRVNSDANRQSVTQSGGQWELKLKKDSSFIESHLDLVSEYAAHWENRRGEIDMHYDEGEGED